MLEERNAFINEMNASFISHKKNLGEILSKLRWTSQSLSGPIKDGQTIDEQLLKPEVLEPSQSTPNEEESFEETEKQDNSKIFLKGEGSSKDSERQYNELLASLSFQPKVKQEKLSDTQFLASLLESERSAKRRRISYRNKVHTKNKSHTEVLREVIREQMEILKEEEEIENKGSGITEKKDEDNEMLEISVMDGNPHLAWQTVGLVVEEQNRDKRKNNDKISANYRSDRRKSFDYGHEKNSSFDYRKHRSEKMSSDRTSCERSSSGHRKRHYNSSKHRRRSRSPDSDASKKHHRRSRSPDSDANKKHRRHSSKRSRSRSASPRESKSSKKSSHRHSNHKRHGY